MVDIRLGPRFYLLRIKTGTCYSDLVIPFDTIISLDKLMQWLKTTVAVFVLIGLMSHRTTNQKTVMDSFGRLLCVHVCVIYMYIQWVRSISFPVSTPVCPVRSNSFDVIPGAHLGQPTVPCLWSGLLGGDPMCMPLPREGECDRPISSCLWLTRVSTAG